MPIFLVLIVIEKIYGYYKGEDTVPLMDGISSLSSGITNAVKDVSWAQIEHVEIYCIYIKYKKWYIQVPEMPIARFI